MDKEARTLKGECWLFVSVLSVYTALIVPLAVSWLQQGGQRNLIGATTLLGANILAWIFILGYYRRAISK